MKRRKFIEYGFAALAAGAMVLFTGCRQKEAPVKRLGNQDKLWNGVVGPEKEKVDLQLVYAKDTQAFYRDASFGKVDPTFTPQVGGG
ncbi:MAG: hypothetical protein HQ589_02970 [Syntrophaceae bacterium]|nr:hypothetical protein [Syntrophaceae bacterium]